MQVATEIDSCAEARRRDVSQFEEDNLVDAQFVQLPAKIRQALLKKGVNPKATPLLSPGSKPLTEESTDEIVRAFGLTKEMERIKK